ncbi:MAG TPA: hypothetical protein VKJ77_04975, partial [Caballeronia sp.]|nr:hypothetical protein [Caballeronia sp.]
MLLMIRESEIQNVMHSSPLSTIPNRPTPSRSSVSPIVPKEWRNGGMAPALRLVRWFDSLVVMIGLLCLVAYLCRASSVSGRCLSHIFRTQGQPANRAHQRYGCVEWNDRPLGYRR